MHGDVGAIVSGTQGNVSIGHATGKQTFSTALFILLAAAILLIVMLVAPAVSTLPCLLIHLLFQLKR